jgi:biopolymer transport protein ExbD
MPSLPAQSREHPINVVSVESQGSLLWNGRPVSQAQVRRYLAIVKQMTSNITVLKLEADAPDKIVAEIKDLMTQGLACTPVTCVEVRAAASKPAP